MLIKDFAERNYDFLYRTILVFSIENGNEMFASVQQSRLNSMAFRMKTHDASQHRLTYRETSTPYHAIPHPSATNKYAYTINMILFANWYIEENMPNAIELCVFAIIP